MTALLTSPYPKSTTGVRRKPKLVRGVGVNDADYKVTGGIGSRTLWVCPVYNTWVNMLARGYSRAFQTSNPAYAGCSVVPEWHSFMAFRSWVLEQPWEGNQLDKDLLFPGNKVYGPATCCFIPQNVNGFLIARGADRGDWPIGVCWSVDKQQFAAQCNNPSTGKRGHIGYFDCPNKAHIAWAARKLEHAKTLAAEQADPRVAKALISMFTAKYEAALDTLTAGA